MIDNNNLLIFGTILIATLLIFVVFKPKEEKVALDAAEFKPFKLIKKEKLSHDTTRFTFALQTTTTRLGLPIGQHISLKFIDADGKGVQRSYTPTTGDETLGTVTFVIKVYKANVHPKFPAGGKMSQHLDSLNIGDTIDMRGPKGHLTYIKKGKFTVKLMRKPLQERSATHFGMIAGGTGITPMLQVLYAIFRDEKTRDGTTTASLLFANQTEEDILVREELEALQKEFPDRFKLHYTVDRPPAEGWKYSTGFIDEAMIKEHVLKDGKDDGSTQVFMCGPPPMIKFACLPNLEKLGLDESKWFSF